MEESPPNSELERWLRASAEYCDVLQDLFKKFDVVMVKTEHKTGWSTSDGLDDLSRTLALEVFEVIPSDVYVMFEGHEAVKTRDRLKVDAHLCPDQAMKTEILALVERITLELNKAKRHIDRDKAGILVSSEIVQEDRERLFQVLVAKGATAAEFLEENFTMDDIKRHFESSKWDQQPKWKQEQKGKDEQKGEPKKKGKKKK